MENGNNKRCPEIKIEEARVAWEEERLESETKMIAEVKLLSESSGKEDVDIDKFLSDYRQSSRKVGPTIADDIKVAALYAIIFSLLAIWFCNNRKTLDLKDGSAQTFWQEQIKIKTTKLLICFFYIKSLCWEGKFNPRFLKLTFNF